MATKKKQKKKTGLKRVGLWREDGIGAVVAAGRWGREQRRGMKEKKITHSENGVICQLLCFPKLHVNTVRWRRPKGLTNFYTTLQHTEKTVAMMESDDWNGILIDQRRRQRQTNHWHPSLPISSSSLPSSSSSCLTDTQHRQTQFDERWRK